MTNEEIFRTFLKSHRKHASYKRQVDTTFSTLNVNNTLSLGFIWESSEEGKPYWRELNKKWKKLCIDFNLKGLIHVPLI